MELLETNESSVLKNGHAIVLVYSHYAVEVTHTKKYTYCVVNVLRTMKHESVLVQLSAVMILKCMSPLLALV